MENGSYELILSWSPSLDDYSRDDHHESAILEKIENKAIDDDFEVRPISSGFSCDAIDGVSTRFLSELAILAVSSGSLIGLIKVVRPFIIEYMKLKSKKEIKLKTKDYEVHLKGESDIDKALETLEKLKDSDNKSKIIQ